MESKAGRRKARKLLEQANAAVPGNATVPTKTYAGAATQGEATQTSQQSGGKAASAADQKAEVGGIEATQKAETRGHGGRQTSAARVNGRPRRSTPTHRKHHGSLRVAKACRGRPRQLTNRMPAESAHRILPTVVWWTGSVRRWFRSGVVLGCRAHRLERRSIQKDLFM